MVALVEYTETTYLVNMKVPVSHTQPRVSVLFNVALRAPKPAYKILL